MVGRCLFWVLEICLSLTDTMSMPCLLHLVVEPLNFRLCIVIRYSILMRLRAATDHPSSPLTVCVEAPPFLLRESLHRSRR